MNVTNPLVKVSGYPATITAAKLVQILSYPAWNKVIQVIDYTRSYEAGLRTGLVLLGLLENIADLIPKKQYEDYVTTLYQFVLYNLDKLDRWEDYLSAWNKVRANTRFSLRYSKESRGRHGNKIEPFIIGEDQNNIYVHFLWTTRHRKETIERKISKQHAGKIRGNLFHETQEQLTLGEIQERYEWIMRFMETGEYDFNPPASRQREERQKTKNRTIKI